MGDRLKGDDDKKRHLREDDYENGMYKKLKQGKAEGEAYEVAEHIEQARLQGQSCKDK